MDVVIFGTGAIGSIIATFLSSSTFNHSIYLIGRKERLAPVATNGLVYKPYGVTEEREWIKTSGYNILNDINDVPRADVVFLTMKAHGLASSLEEAKVLIETSNPHVIITMNGLGLKDVALEHISEDKIIETVAFYPSRLEGNVVLNTGGNSWIISEDTRVARDVFDQLFSEGTLDLRFDANFRRTQWTKAIINVCINAIAAITQLPVGRILETSSLTTIMQEIVAEATRVANKAGILFEHDLYELFLTFARRDPEHRPSMQQDITRRRKTEINFLNGYIAKQGKMHGIPTPCNEAIVTLIKEIEKSFD